MTVSSTSAISTVFGNGVTTSFSYPFIADSASDIVVTYTDADGIATVLSPSQYTLTINAPATGQLWGVGGTVLFPTAGSPIASGTALTIQRLIPLQQLVTTQNQGAFYAAVTEEALDVLCMEVQQISARTGQSRGAWVTGTSYGYGDLVQDGINGNDTLNYYLNVVPGVSNVWQSDLAAGDWVLVIDTQLIASYAAAAAASATAAATSATAAATSAASSATSATASAASAVTAATSATNAASSATTATTQASAAGTSATNAANSATASAASATTATTSATTATTQAGLASTFSTSASTSATNAAASATAAAASAAQAAGAFVGTSTTSNTIGTGTITFTTQSGLNLGTGGFITVAETSTPANYFHGQVTSYSSTTLVMNCIDDGGSGTHTDWTITTSGPQGPGGAGSGTVNSGTAGQLAYYASSTTAVSGDINATVSAGALTLGQASSVQGSLVLSGSTSGTTTLAVPVAGTGTMTLQAGTDTVVARATTDTLTNKTLTASSNVIGGVTMTLGSDGTGDIYYRNSSGVLTRLARGTANQLLHGGASIPAYSAVVEADLSLTDVTTANVTSTAHGFAPKSAADATKFLNGDTNPAYAQVKDSDLSTSDVTTNNASTSKHGFLKKLSNTSTEFMNGQGNWATPASGGLQPQMTVFTASGTFTTSANITSSTRFKFTVIGGGGGGGAGASGLATEAAGGGGAGATSIYEVSGLAANTGYTVTVGAAGTAGSSGTAYVGGTGGTSSVVIGGTTPTAAGGVGGPSSAGGTTCSVGASGGTATNGTINVSGGDGFTSVIGSASNTTFGGSGGSSSMGGGGRGGNNPVSNTGTAGKAYGSGGGGGMISGLGGAGKAGIVIVEWQE